MRLVRYCCVVLKENTGKNRFVATGVRWAESTKRRSRGVMEVLNKDPKKRIILMNDNRHQLLRNQRPHGHGLVLVSWHDDGAFDSTLFHLLELLTDEIDCFRRICCRVAVDTGRWSASSAFVTLIHRTVLLSANRSALPCKRGKEKTGHLNR